MIVTGHTPNLLPGVSVMEKIRAADVCVWMDLMQYERHGFCNRNRFSDGKWFTVPVAESDTFARFRDVRIADPAGVYRAKVARTLEYKLGRGIARPYVARLGGQHETLMGLTMSLLREMMAALNLDTPWRFQSALASGVYTDVSDGLAAMTAELGGTVWLSGPSGRNYLDEQPFHARGIEVRYFEWTGANPCALEALVRPELLVA